MNALDQQTATQIFPAQVDTSNCPRSTGQALGGGGFGCDAAVEDIAFRGEGEGEGPNVVELDDVGPFGDIVVVDAPEVDAIFGFLEDNNYTLTGAMRPVIRDYHQEGKKFLALRLQPDQAAEAIQPLVFTCPQEEGGGVSIPLRLTSVAAEPEMSVTVFVIGNERFVPMNYTALTVDPADVHTLPFGGANNYFPLVSKLVDDAGGRAFVTETSLSNLQVFTINGDTVDVPHVTRLYTRISPWEMTQDPVFISAGDSNVQQNIIDLSTRVIEICDLNIAPPTCGTTYCGPGARCVASAVGDACVCPQGQLARAITTPNGPQTYCVEDDFVDPLAELEIDACAGNPCGPNGSCTTAFGRAACACDAGFAAAPAGVGGVSCAEILEEIPGDPLDWTAAIEQSGPSCGQMPASQYALCFGSLALILFGLRRMQRRSK